MRRFLNLLAALAFLAAPAVHAGVIPGIGGVSGGAFSACVSQTFTTAGSTTFTASTLCAYSVTVIGGGGGGAGTSDGTNGGQSVFNTTLTANGGNAASGATGGTAGTSSGGDTNLTGNAGSNGPTGTGGDGNHSCTLWGNGGAGADPGTAGNGGPGAGGGGFNGGGGGAGCSIKAYSKGTLSGSISLTVGDKGAGGTGAHQGGNGTVGEVIITAS